MRLQAIFALTLIHSALSFNWPECSKYTYLQEGDRAVGNTNITREPCDKNLAYGWYRFRGDAGDEMPTTCPPERRCGTYAPGWLNGNHPSVAQGSVLRQACYHWGGDCCRWQNDIVVRNCSGFYVYKLRPPPVCNLRYCGNRQAPPTTPSPTTSQSSPASSQVHSTPATSMPSPTPTSYPECSNYNYLEEEDRAVGNSDQSSVKCDRSLKESWYRFRGNAGNEMPTACPPKQRCGTHAPGWLNGSHPTVAEGAVQRQVCFHWSSGCCQWQNNIQIRNCSGFYVYKLKAPPACRLRYCGNRQAAPPSSTPPPTTSRPTPTSYPECSNYNYLEEEDRAVGNSNQASVKCDRSLKEGWYRFRGNAGNEMPTACPPKLRCGTHAPGWLNGSHPTVAEGVVQRQVCFHWSSGCCQWQSDIQVRNCGGFYVYKLKPTRFCSLRYCGNREAPTPSTPSPTTFPPTPTSNSECSNYNILSEATRAQTYNKSSPLICDSALSGWYRFRGEAGNQMPQSCVKKLHCGTHAPGWLNGSHPAVADGAVKRKVCFHWSNNCCRWSTEIDVRNCGGFYVYKLHRPPACTLRYCGNGLQRPTPTPTPTPTSKPTVHPTPTAANHGFMILCLPSSMMVNISRKSLSMDPSLLHLSDPGCGAVRVDRKYVVMETPLEGCGTVRRSIGKRVQQFHNKVVVPSGYEKKRSFLEFPFMCTYNKFGIPGIRGRLAPLHKRGHVGDSTSDDTATYV